MCVYHSTTVSMIVVVRTLYGHILMHAHAHVVHVHAHVARHHNTITCIELYLVNPCVKAVSHGRSLSLNIDGERSEVLLGISECAD